MPAASMTGFGQADAHGFHVEIRGVNHRFKEIRVKVPKDLGMLENAVREIVQETVHRGKVEVVVTRAPETMSSDRLKIDWDLAAAYHADLCEMAQRFGGEVTFRDVLLVPGVLVPLQENPEDMIPLVQDAARLALRNFLDARRREGAHLLHDIAHRVKILYDIAGRMKELARLMTNVYKNRLHANLNALLADRSITLDESRLEQEVALLADKSDITEELVRLEGHIRLLEETVTEVKGPVGRQIDFIIQEINREVNTIGSKSQLADLSRLVIEAKSEIEKIREQIQNIE